MNTATTLPAVGRPGPAHTLGTLAQLGLVLTLSIAGTAWASTPVEKVVCTDAPRSAWLSEAQARAKFQAERYVLVRYKVSRGNCHEFYAIEPGGAVVEAYQHPITGETVRLTRIPAPTAAAPSAPPPSPPTSEPTSAQTPAR